MIEAIIFLAIISFIILGLIILPIMIIIKGINKIL